MSKRENNSGKALAIGAAVGAVLGVVTGILFAPKSGKETREDIKDAAQKAKEKLLSESDKLHEELNKLIAKVEVLAKEKGDKITVKAKEALKHATVAKDNLADKAKEIKAGKKTDDKDLKEALKKAQEAQEALTRFLKK